MASERYSTKCPTVKRLMREAQDLRLPTDEYYAQPLEENLFEWHFTLRGPPDSAFDGGIYHGKIILPSDYPMKPPHIILLTPNGRFEINKKICLSISGHHPETWQPCWSIRTALLAIIGFMPSKAHGAIGSMDLPDEERQDLARKSRHWICPTCGPIALLLKELPKTAEERMRESTQVAENNNKDNKKRQEELDPIEMADNERPQPPIEAHIFVESAKSGKRKINAVVKEVEDNRINIPSNEKLDPVSKTAVQTQTTKQVITLPIDEEIRHDPEIEDVEDKGTMHLKIFYVIGIAMLGATFVGLAVRRFFAPTFLEV